MDSPRSPTVTTKAQLAPAKDNRSTSTPPINDPEDLSESFYGSVGSESILIQKVPSLTSASASKLPCSSSPVSALLFQAIEENSPQRCKSLFMKSPEAIRSVNIQNRDGECALHIASHRGYLSICELLLDYGNSTKIDIQNGSLRTPLHLASQVPHLAVAQLLVRSGADINAVDSSGATPLHLAVSSGDVEFVAWFLSKKPNLSQENREGLTVWDMVTSLEVFEVLKQFSSAPVGGVPSRVGPLDFSILSRLGKGSFGEVYLVRKKDSMQLYAMKVLKKEKVLHQNLIKYAMTERNVLSCLKHPFIVGLNFAFQNSDRLFLILDYCPGRDLSYHISREKRLDPLRAKYYLCEILLAIEELHSRGIIFRDLKPENVVLDANGHALLTDFGLSKEGMYDNVKASSFCGSVAYLAPEVIKRKSYGKTVDWYLLGVLYYEMVVGIPPYFSPSKDQLFDNILRGKLRVPSSMSEESKELLKDLLRRNPDLRLGAQRDAEEVKGHNFFKGIDWRRVQAKELPLPGPEVAVSPEEHIDPESVFMDLGSSMHSKNKVLGWTFISNW